MDPKIKYQFDNMQRGYVQWGFHKWLKVHVGEEAAKVYKDIICSDAVISVMDGYPRDLLTLQQKKMITYSKNQMWKAAAWLKEQGCYGE
jgi:hypothetical protein